MLLNHFFYIFNISLSLPVCGSRSFFWWRKMRIPSPPRIWRKRLRTASLSCFLANTAYTCSEIKKQVNYFVVCCLPMKGCNIYPFIRCLFPFGTGKIYLPWHTFQSFRFHTRDNPILSLNMTSKMYRGSILTRRNQTIVGFKLIKCLLH